MSIDMAWRAVVCTASLFYEKLERISLDNMDKLKCKLL